MFLPLMAHLRVGPGVGRPRTRPEAVRGDKAHSPRAIRGHLRARGTKAVITEPDDRRAIASGAAHAAADPPARRCRLQEPERDRTPLLPHQTVARARDQIRQARHHLPRRRRPQRRHHLDKAIVRHALGLCATTESGPRSWSCGTPTSVEASPRGQIWSGLCAGSHCRSRAKPPHITVWQRSSCLFRAESAREEDGDAGCLGGMAVTNRESDLASAARLISSVLEIAGGHGSRNGSRHH